MKTFLVSIGLFLFCFVGLAQEQKTIFGTVTDGQNPIERVTISVLDKDVTTSTDAKGAYTIKAAKGDILQFVYTGMKTITIKVEDVTRILSPVMIIDVTELDEVTVEASSRISQTEMAASYRNNENVIRTAFGFIDAERAAGNVQVIGEDVINAAYICILDLLRNRFSGVLVKGDCLGNESSVVIRGAGSINNVKTAVFDIDGQIFTEVPIWISISNVKRVAVLNNLATTTQYGSAGNGGVVVINTFSGNQAASKITDLARLRNNYVTGDVLSKDQVSANMPNYLKELNASGTLKEAKAIFEKNALTYANSAYYFLDTYDYFTKKWNETSFADKLIEKNFNLFENNSVLLKALAYSYQAQNRFKKANTLFQEVFKKRPEYAQSYFDVANSYRDLNKFEQSASIYARYKYLQDEGFLALDTLGFDPIFDREFNNLLALRKYAPSKKSKKLYVAEEDFNGTRLVFEWNDSEAEFDLQFVNPGDQYFTWKHSLADNEDIILREKQLGYNTTEQLIDNSLAGTWKINVKYLGNKSLTPTYLKATIYYNYGNANQRKEVKLLKLSIKNVNQEWFKISNAGVTAFE